VLSLVYENLANTRTATLETLSNTEVENLRLMDKNRELASQLLELTAQETSWRNKVDDEALLARIQETEEEYKKTRAQRDTMKSVISAIIVGSGVDWARDDRLRDLVLDELDRF
jgi:Centromere protein H (CENP-H)